MPDWFASNAPSAVPATPAPKGDWFDLYSPTRKPANPEDFIETKTSTAREVAKGVLKGAVKSFSDLGELAVNAGMIPGVLPSAFNPDMRSPVFTRTEEATTATNTPQRVGRGLETAAELAIPAYEAGKLAVTAAKAIPSLARSAAEPIARALASETPLLTQGRQLAAKKILGHVLESTPSAANKGGKLVAAGSRPSVEGELATMLDDLRAPEPPPSVELPPPAELPPGYTPRSTVPPVAEPAAAPAPQGRLVPVKAPPVEAQIADALAEARQPTPPALVTTPPPAELPPGYTPRSTVPKVVRERMAARQAKMAGPAAPVAEPAAPPKRAYFLKSPDEMLAARMPSEPVKPSGSITIDDLPEAWKSRTGQDLFPTTGAEAKEITAALRQEIKDRGMTIGQAIAAVSKNRSISTELRYQIQRSLAGSAKAGGK